MIRLIKELFSRLQPATASQPPFASDKDVTFESLRDNYELRFWHYKSARASLGKTNPRLLNWIGTIDYSGYTREECLRELIARPEPGDENRILLRLQDWVPQVQVLARNWVLEHFRSLPIEAIFANQRLILYLSRKKRIQDDIGLLEIKANLLARTRQMSKAQFFEFSPLFRRFLFVLSFESDKHLRPWILDDPEPFNRLHLLSSVEFSEITSEEQLRLQSDKSIFIRRRLFQAKIDGGITPTRDELISLALDPNRSLRERGQFYLKKLYSEDCYAIYQASSCEKFFFIADYAKPEDVEHFLKGVRSGSRPIQEICLKALAQSAPEKLKELDIALLVSQNRNFRSSLIPHLPRLLTVDEILKLRNAFEKGSRNGTSSFLRVLERKSFWRFVDESLSILLSEHSGAPQHSIEKSLHNRVAVNEPLTHHLREKISHKVASLREKGLSKNQGIIEMIEFTLKTS